jgi:hypothetical protein
VGARRRLLDLHASGRWDRTGARVAPASEPRARRRPFLEIVCPTRLDS